MSKQREHWGSRLGFILAAAGSAIGLGSLWRFPSVVGENGGGLFVLSYLFFTFFFGIPLFIGELILGRSTQKSPVGAYGSSPKGSKNWKIAGWLGVFTCFIILSFYSVISGWTLNYALMSITDFTSNLSTEQIGSTFETLYKSGDINIFWHFIFMLLTMGVVYTGIRKGIEYWSQTLMPMLLILLLGLFAYSTTLDGFGRAVEFIFYPHLDTFKPSSLLEALSMALFTLSLGMGIILTYGSYMKSHEDIVKTSFIIQALNIFITLIASLIIFPIVFSYGFTPNEGAGLVFKTMPTLFAQMKGTLVLSTVFFTLMVFTALTSTISLLEVLIANFMELYNWPRKKTVLIVGGITFLMGVPSALAGSGILFGDWETIYGIDFLSTLGKLTDWLLPLGALLLSIHVGWVMELTTLRNEFSNHKFIKKAFPFWLWCLRWAIPVGVVIIILQKGEIINIDKLLIFSGKA
jgi:neurotransmitter:Na+ symporter, NSS family